VVKILLFLAQEQTKQDHGPEDRSGSILDNRWWAGAKATRNGLTGCQRRRRLIYSSRPARSLPVLQIDRRGVRR